MKSNKIMQVNVIHTQLQTIFVCKCNYSYSVIVPDDIDMDIDKIRYFVNELKVLLTDYDYLRIVNQDNYVTYYRIVRPALMTGYYLLDAIEQVIVDIDKHIGPIKFCRPKFF